MATNEILVFAPNVASGNIWDQAAYTGSTVRLEGNIAGTPATRKDMNKVLLQTSTISSALAQFMSDNQIVDITDQVTVANLATYLEQSIHNTPLYFGTAGGGADALTVTFSPAMTALADGAGLFIVKAVSPNATTTPTLACNGLAAKTIIKANGNALSVGDIVSNFYMLLTYDAAQDKYILNNPAASQASNIGQVLHVRNQLANNVNGGTFTLGSWVTRPLETVVLNTISGSSLAANVITLPAGDYRISTWSCAFNVGRHQSRVYNVTGSATLIVGSTENTSTGADPVQTRSTSTQIVTLASSTDIRLDHQCSNTQSSTGLGKAANFGEGEIYAEVYIEKL